MHPYRLPLVILVALAALTGCGGDDELKPAASPPPGAAQSAAPRTDARLVSDTLREFRRRYESKNPTACELVTSSFKPTTGGSPSECESAVKGHGFSYAIVELSREGNRIGKRSATVLSTLRRDDRDGGSKAIDGEVRLRKEGSAWLISSIGPR
jgi:hypothetical protein